MKRKMLVYGHRKQDEMYWDASTPENEKRAVEALFEQTTYWSGEYADLDEKNIGECEGQLAIFEEQVALALAADPKLKNVLQLPDLIERRNKAKWELESLKSQKLLLDAALKGDSKAKGRLLHLRKSYEYEGWRFVQYEDFKD